MASMQALYQDFSAPDSTGDIAARVTALRAALAEAGLAGFIVPREDEYQGEYVPAGNERLQWLTGFNGSAGMAILLHDHAALFVDGRYTLQAAHQTDTSLISVIHSADQKPSAWLADHIEVDTEIGIDPRLHSATMYRQFERLCIKAGARLRPLATNPIDALWHDRPALPHFPVQDHPIDVAGETASHKIESICTLLDDAGQNALLVTQPENIAWLLNIRGTDVPHTPFVLSTAILHSDQTVDWYIASERISDTLRARLGASVRLIPPTDLARGLAAQAGKAVWLDPITTPMWFVQNLKGAQIYEAADPIALPKARKNATEISGAEQAHLWDGVALCRFLHWLQTSPEPKTEISVACQLEVFRRDQPRLRDLSFDTISGSGPNGAIVHYRVNQATDRPLEDGTLYLVDLGGQYDCGTTDVTRTVLMGTTPHPDMVGHFTRVLRGHIALAKVTFPIGTTGAQLDALARAPLWEAGLDFDHGTGHGVGSYLSVHEGPHRISKGSDVALQPGMIVSNEPGYYRAGAYGIRIENLQYVVDASPKGDRPMLGFQTLTRAPIDRRLIDATLLAPDERDWLNQYHDEVYHMVSPYLDKPVAHWLKAQCAPIA